MNTFRIVFYAVLITGLITTIKLYKRAINEYNRNHDLSHVTFHSHSSQNAMVLRRSEGENISPPVVVAPWTKPGKEFWDSKKNAPRFEHRAFVFAEPEKLDSEYGVKMTLIDKHEQHKIQKEASKRLCERSKKASPNSQPSLRCNKNMVFLKCVSCSESDGTWYSAVSETGAVFGKVVNGTSLHFPNYNDGPFLYQQLDIAVPIAGQDDELERFVEKLGYSLKKFRSGIFGAKISVRLLVTRFSFDEPAFGTKELEKFRKKLAKMSGLTDIADKVIFVEVPDSPDFSRAKAVNALHRETNHNDGSALALIDVDLSITSKFLQNALAYPFPGAAAYFPIMFSAYDPKTVELVDQLVPSTKRNLHSDHHGHWRRYSFGMYVIAGSDAARLSMDESFSGWGGEDNDFFARVSSELNVIRLHEPGLTHIWHDKHCELGAFVEKKWYVACLGSMSHAIGSQLGMYLKNLKDHDPHSFNEIARHIGDQSEHKINEEEPDASEENPTVLVGVISSRENFATRVKSIVETWGQPQNIPQGTMLRYFVGTPPPDSEFYGKSVEEDKAHLAEIAGIKDPSMIVVMSDVEDDEYPPVRKNTAMIQYLNQIVEDLENNPDAPSTFQWIYKVDDDSYVNFGAMLDFVRTRKPEGYHLYGERGTGRKEDRDGLKAGGLVKPYCTGGPGYIMSRQAVKDTAPYFPSCVSEFDNSKYREFLWHSDSVIGICFHKYTGAGCWDDDDYYEKRIFRHNLKKEAVFPPSSRLLDTIASHPFKDPLSMMRQHLRYVEATLSK